MTFCRGVSTVLLQWTLTNPTSSPVMYQSLLPPSSLIHCGLANYAHILRGFTEVTCLLKLKPPDQLAEVLTVLYVSTLLITSPKLYCNGFRCIVRSRVSYKMCELGCFTVSPFLPPSLPPPCSPCSRYIHNVLEMYESDSDTSATEGTAHKYKQETTTDMVTQQPFIQV